MSKTIPNESSDSNLLPTKHLTFLSSRDSTSSILGRSGEGAVRVRPAQGADVVSCDSIRQFVPRVPSSAFYLASKRIIDVFLSVVGLVVSSPVMAIVAAMIKCSDGGPILFRQTRVGKDGKTFNIYKFRSMVINAEDLMPELIEHNKHEDNRTFKILNDPRITSVGRFLRRLSLDELPQLWNVVRGEMSIVGPRPALPSEVVLYEADDLQRLSVKPGVTCIWQVSGRSNLSFQDQIRLDLEYIQRRCVVLDLKLILLTIPAVLRADGAA